MPAPGEALPRPSRYQAYLLRLWRDGPGAPWRAALEVPSGEATFRFGTVGALFAFLRDQLAAEPEDTMRKYRAVFARPNGVAWPKEQSYNALRGIATTTAEDWAKANLV